MMRVQLSGKIEVTVDGEIVHLGSNKAQVVLAALALNAGSLVPVGRLVDLVWSEEPPRTAEKTLQAYIARLRAACGAASIERVGDAYRLAVEPDDVDLVRFDRLLDENQCAEAAELWQGPPLAGLVAPGLDPAIARFNERFLAASEELLAEEIREGRSADAIGQLRELAMANPFREGVWALLMRALYASGRQAEALRVYGDARDHLVAGLGIEPGPALQDLERQVLAQTVPVPCATNDAGLTNRDAAQSTRTITSPQVGGSTEFPPQLKYRHGVDFVGRDSHRATLHGVWKRLRNSRVPHLVLLAGEPGVGKTRLAAQFALEIHDSDGPLVVYGRCHEDHRSSFRPFAEALTNYGKDQPEGALRSELGPHPELLLPVMPWLADRYPELAGRPLPAETRQLDIFDAVSSFLERASVSPLVIVLDDIHWADQATLDLILHLARNARSGEFLVVATYRDVEVDRSHPLFRVLGELRRETNVERIAVRGIDAIESIALTEAVLGHELSDAGKVQAEKAGIEAGGNPFFLQEMLRHFMRSGVLGHEHGRWVPSNPETITESVPEGIREVVRRRLDQVSDGCNSLLRIASALGDSIEVSLLITVSELDEDTALDLLDEALEAGLLTDAAAADQYEFSHALIRQALYDEFSTSRRLRLHLRIADAIAATGRTDGSSVVDAAHHYLAAGPVAAMAVMAESVRVAAAFTSGQAAYAEAAHLIERALDVADNALDADVEFALVGDLAVSRLRLWDSKSASQSLERMVDLAEHTSTEVLVEGVAKVSRSILTVTGSGHAASALRRLFDIATSPTDLDRRQRTTLAVERFCARCGDLDLEGMATQLSLMTDDEVDRLAYAAGEVPVSLGTLTTLRDHVSELAESLRPGLQGAVEWLDFIRAMVSWQPLHTNLETLQLHRRDPRAICARVSGPCRAMRRGDFADAKRQADRLGNDHLPLFFVFREGWVAHEQENDSYDAARTLPSADRALISSPSYAMLPQARVGPPDKALIRELAPEATSISRLPALVNAAWEAGLTDIADDLWRRLEPAAGLAIPVYYTNYVVAVDYYLGLLAELRGDRDQAIELHRNVITTSRRLGYVVDEGYAAWQLVRLLGQRNQPGDIEHARNVAAEALEMLEPTTLVRRKRMINEALADLPQ